MGLVRSLRHVPSAWPSGVTNPDAYLRHVNGGNHRADEVAFDPRHQIFIVANPADEPFPFVTLISTIPDANGHHHIIKKIFFDGGHGPMPWRSTLRTVSNSPLGILGPVISLWPSRRLDLARPLATAALWRSPPMGTRMI